MQGLRKITAFVFLLISNQVISQDKQLTMVDAMVNSRTTLAPETLKQLQFIKGTNDFIYIKAHNGTDMWVRGNVKNTSGEPFLTLVQINERLRFSKLDTLAALPPVQFNNDNYIITIKGNRYSFNITDNNYKLLGDTNTRGKSGIDESSSGYFAYTDSFNLFVTKDGRTRRVSHDGHAGLVYGQAVHQQEFGIRKGTFWSTDGNKLAFYRMDQTMVPDYPITNWKSRPAKVENIKYPMAGEKSHHVTIGIYNINGQTTWVETGLPAEQYLTNITWSPDDKSIFIAVLNREQNHMKLNEYDAVSGRFIKTIFEEKNEKYVEPQNPLLFVKNKPDQFIWQSRRDGWNHLYLYNINGTLIRQLTAGQFEVTDVKGFNEKGDKIFYVSTAASPISKNLYEVNIGNARSRRITQGDFNHITSLSSSGEFVLDNYSSPDNPRTIELIETKSGKRVQLLQASNPLAAYSMGKMNIFTLKSGDGYDLYARMYKPVNFDSTKKYPVIVYWYGGPHAQMILNSWNGGSGDYWFQYLAQRGFLVFTVDTRGSAGRGLAFEQAIFRNAGKAQMEDLNTGIAYLKSLPYADASKMGLFGWSYGGFMTTSFLLNHPGVFKAGVAGGPVIDWKLYEIMYTERYMDTPAENPEGYSSTDLTKIAHQLKDKLLLIHGTQDPVVVQQHSVNFVRAAIDKGVQVDYMIYPGHEHNVLGKDRAHLYQKVTDFLMQHLK